MFRFVFALLLVLALSLTAEARIFGRRGVQVNIGGGNVSRGVGHDFNARGFDPVVARRFDARGNEIEVTASGRKFVNGVRIR